MHIKDVLRVMENAYPEGIHNIIVHIFDVVLKDRPVLPPYTLSQLKPQILIKVGATIHSTDGGVPVCVTYVYLRPSPELPHNHTRI